MGTVGLKIGNEGMEGWRRGDERMVNGEWRIGKTLMAHGSQKGQRLCVASNERRVSVMKYSQT